MTNREIYEFYLSLQQLQKSDIRFPAKVAYAIMRNDRLTSDITRSIEFARESLIQEYCDPTPDEQGRYHVKDGAKEKFQKELDDLFKVENTITLYKIQLSDLDNLPLSLSDMHALYPMISEEV